MYSGGGCRSNLHPLTSLVRCQVDMWRIVLMEIESMFHTVEPRYLSVLCVELIISESLDT